MELSEFLSTWTPNRFLSAANAARLFIDLRRTCKVLQNGTYMYIFSQCIVIEPKPLFADRPYTTNERGIIYQNMLDVAGNVQPGDAGSASGPCLNYDSVRGTHTITLNDFYVNLPVTSWASIQTFFSPVTRTIDQLNSDEYLDNFIPPGEEEAKKGLKKFLKVK